MYDSFLSSNQITRVNPHMVTIGMNSAPTRPALHEDPQLTPSHLTHHRSTRLTKTNDALPPNRFFKQTPTVLFFFPSNTMTSGECTRKPKPHSGPLKISTSRPTLQIGIVSLTTNATSSPTSLPSLPHMMALLTRTSAVISRRKPHSLKSAASTASKLLLRISTVKRTHSSSTHTSKTPRRKITSYGRSKLYRASNEKRSGPLNGATPHLLASPNA